MHKNACTSAIKKWGKFTIIRNYPTLFGQQFSNQGIVQQIVAIK